MDAKVTQLRSRPSPPSAARQWSGVFACVLVVAAVDFGIRNGMNLRDPGGLYLLLVLTISFVCGMRAGLGSCAVIVGYLIFASVIPGSAMAGVPWGQRHAFGLLFVLGFCTVTIGLVQKRILAADIKQFDAAAAGDAEKSQRLVAESALRESEDLWRIVQSASKDAIVATEPEGNITLWNANAETMFGWTAEEVIGRRLIETVVPPGLRVEYDEALRRFVQDAGRSLGGRHLKVVGLRKDGVEFPVEVTLANHESNGRKLVIGFMRDITEVELLNERLRQARRLQAIGTLAGGIAHDFNNIIAAIAGNAALVRAENPKSPALLDSLEEIEKATQRATSIVGQILRFSRSQPSEASAIDVEPTLNDAIKLLRATIPAAVRITTEIESGLPTVLAEPSDLHQIVLNLGVNAAQAMRDRGGRFEVRAAVVDLDTEAAATMVGISAGRFLRLSFADTGVGMDWRTQQRIFEPFYTTKQPGEGTGLGLSVVYGIIERLCGTITLYSEPGRGTAFNVYLPVTNHAPEPLAEQAPRRVEGRKERILYVDDDEALVFLMTRMLTRQNYDAAGFAHSDEALNAFLQTPDSFDVVITDMSMPQIDGPDFVRRVREVRPDVPVVMVTGYIRPEDAEKARSLGVQHLVLKPNSVTEMGEILAGLLGH